MGADSRVMAFFPAPLAEAASDALAARLGRELEQRGWGVWAVDIPGVTPFAGMVGLNVPTVPLPFSPCVEVLWRLAPAWWGQGYATEAAGAALDFGFRELGLAEIVSFTALANVASQGVMRRLGMVADGTFDHPALPEGHWLRRHVLYRKKAP